ncbi:Clp protease N-terminal domain-containing protein [Nocardia sp. R6R-6]|uniref:Clp protease N-terminal domain-containing protein n=1 Tax=Nocardia sp. R6R-6 TaxID=3459303 RepID=UPI00403DC0E0
MKLILTSAFEEAARRGDRRVGTDHLLLGLLHDNSRAANALGVSLPQARAASDALDVAALAAVGIRADTLDENNPPVPVSRRLPLTSGARAVFKRAIDEARPLSTGPINATHFLVALLTTQRPDPAAELLAALDVDPDTVRARLSEPDEGETG